MAVLVYPRLVYPRLVYPEEAAVVVVVSDVVPPDPAGAVVVVVPAEVPPEDPDAGTGWVIWPP